MSLSLITTWLTGAINGYKVKEDGLPNYIKYNVMVLASGINIIKGFSNIKLPITSPGVTVAGLFVGIPLMTGATFCLGNHFGNAIRWAEDEPRSGKSGTKVKLL